MLFKFFRNCSLNIFILLKNIDNLQYFLISLKKVLLNFKKKFNSFYIVMIWVKFDLNWPSGFEKEIKSLNNSQTDGWTDIQTDRRRTKRDQKANLSLQLRYANIVKFSWCRRMCTYNSSVTQQPEHSFPVDELHICESCSDIQNNRY